MDLYRILNPGDSEVDASRVKDVWQDIMAHQDRYR
jgi:hypothetical protein